MGADALLSRLDLVRQTGPGRWIARCPAHADKSPTLSVRELEDARTLVHCFAGCGALDVLHAVGLELRDLFPPRPDTPGARYRKAPAVPAMDALRCLGGEAWIVLVLAARAERGRLPSPHELDRLSTAVGRIAGACQITGAWR